MKALNLKAAAENKFADTTNHWAKDYIAAAADNGIVLGYDNNLFGPDDLITREQMAVMVMKAMKLDTKTSETSFLDKDQISVWARNYVASAVKEKIIIGYSDDTFKPNKKATRAEAVTVIVNGLKSISK